LGSWKTTRSCLVTSINSIPWADFVDSDRLIGLLVLFTLVIDPLTNVTYFLKEIACSWGKRRSKTRAVSGGYSISISG